MVESLTINIGLFAVAAFVIGVVGTRLAKVADRLADKTGWGEAIVGAIFLGGSTPNYLKTQTSFFVRSLSLAAFFYCHLS